MDWDDERNVEASNFGPCLTIFAPGTSITVASGHSDTGITHGGFEETGTSLSTPLVAGTIASLVTKEGNKSPAQMRALLVSYAAKNTGIKNLNGSPDVLLQSLIRSGSLQ
ncbi:subtilisin-like protease 3-like protein [Mycena crocata]|nr:subtilisin-like protease 3-like protein [Mycena crocata]